MYIHKHIHEYVQIHLYTSFFEISFQRIRQAHAYRYTLLKYINTCILMNYTHIHSPRPLYSYKYEYEPKR